MLVTYGKAIGTVPASVDHVTFTLTDGSTHDASPRGGLYTAPPEAQLVTFTDGDGERTEIHLMPLSTKADDIEVPRL